jgi:uncharacterized sulfatase
MSTKPIQAAVLALAAAALAAERRPLAAAPRPNILFIYSDDQAWWTLGTTGNRDVRTPVLDRFFTQGARLDNCFAATPVCSPARASLLTSRYGTEVGITDWIDPRQDAEIGLDPSVVTWPKLLADSGYATALFGKWHLGNLDRHHPTRHGFQTFIGSRGSPDKLVNATFEIDGRNTKLPGLLTDNVTRYALEYLRQPHDRPFLMCVHYRNPHGPYIPVAEDIWDRYKDLKAILPAFPDLDTGLAGQIMPKYLASVAELDRHVGKLLDALEETHLAAGTIVIFSSDQGYNVGHHGVWHKGNARWILNSTRGKDGPEVQRPNVFDTSLRVPAAIRWPGVIPPGTAVRETISGVDWFPTLVAMAGAAVPEGQVTRGRSFLPLLKGEHIAWDNDLYAEYSQRHYAQADLRTYRTSEWKLVRDFLNPGRDELYHLDADPDESRNLIDSPDAEARDAQRRLQEKLLARMRAKNDPALRLAATRPAASTR